MDEPMHSTNHVDGEIMLKSVMYYLSKCENLQLILTSHFFAVQKLAEELPKYFKNLCVKAKIQGDGDIDFDFKLCKGGSTQTIGIELLEKENFPSEILETATKMKNKKYLE